MSLPSQPQAYGAGMAGGSFDPVSFIKRPQVILRIVSWVFSIIVFGCISAGGYYRDHCQMRDSGACGYGIGIGVTAFLLCIGFLIIDVLFDNMSSVQHRKYAVLADLVVSALWTFLWFVGFCFLTDQWRRRDDMKQYVAPHGHGKDNIQASIAFSFFSIFTWAALAFFAFRRYREGTSETFTTGYQDNQQQNQSSPYSSFPGSDASDPYQQPPFSNQKSGDIPDYQPPTY
ncbi:synaptogyrin-2-like [Mercenaria mercenaria]|uniref:synaptogyrin-2-like n=1 Tax=Mercenaria mercenaria TaxID=6596 RepID=UPI001E1D4B8B|nr:synaptogyrin-2-like [Mercenaria mercenaria]